MDIDLPLDFRNVGKVDIQELPHGQSVAKLLFTHIFNQGLIDPTKVRNLPKDVESYNVRYERDFEFQGLIATINGLGIVEPGEQAMVDFLNNWKAGFENIANELNALQQEVAKHGYVFSKEEFQRGGLTTRPNITGGEGISYYEGGGLHLPQDIDYKTTILDDNIKFLQNSLFALSQDCVSLVGGNLFGTTLLGNTFVASETAGPVLKNVREGIANFNATILTVREEMKNGVALCETLNKGNQRYRDWQNVLNEWFKDLTSITVANFNNAQEYQNYVNQIQLAFQTKYQQYNDLDQETHRFVGDMYAFLSRTLSDYAIFVDQNRLLTIEISNLQQEGIRKDATIAQLRVDNQQLQTRITEISNALEQWKTIAANKEAQLTKLSVDNAALLQNVHQQYSNTIETYKNAEIVLRTEIENLKAEGTALAQKATTAQTQWTTYGTTNNTLLQQSQQQVQHLGSQIDALNNTLALKEARILELQNAEANLITLWNKKDTEKNEVTNQLFQLKELFDALQLERNQLQFENENFRQQNIDLEGTIETLNASSYELSSKLFKIDQWGAGLVAIFQRQTQDVLDPKDYMQIIINFLDEYMKLIPDLQKTIQQQGLAAQSMQSKAEYAAQLKLLGGIIQDGDLFVRGLDGEFLRLHVLNNQLKDTQEALKQSKRDYESLHSRDQETIRGLEEQITKMQANATLLQGDVQKTLQKEIADLKAYHASEKKLWETAEAEYKKSIAQLTSQIPKDAISPAVMEAIKQKYDAQTKLFEQMKKDIQGHQAEVQQLKSTSASEFKAMENKYEQQLNAQRAFFATKEGEVVVLQQRIMQLEQLVQNCNGSKVESCTFTSSGNTGFRFRKGARCMHPNSLANIGIFV